MGERTPRCVSSGGSIRARLHHAIDVNDGGVSCAGLWQLCRTAAPGQGAALEHNCVEREAASGRTRSGNQAHRERHFVTPLLRQGAPLVTHVSTDVIRLHSARGPVDVAGLKHPSVSDAPVPHREGQKGPGHVSLWSVLVHKGLWGKSEYVMLASHRVRRALCP